MKIKIKIDGWVVVLLEEVVPAVDDPKGDVLKREIREYGRAVHRKQKKLGAVVVGGIVTGFPDFSSNQLIQLGLLQRLLVPLEAR